MGEMLPPTSRLKSSRDLPSGTAQAKAQRWDAAWMYFLDQIGRLLGHTGGLLYVVRPSGHVELARESISKTAATKDSP